MLFTFLQPPGKITTLSLSKSWLKLLGEGHSTEPDKRAVMILSCEELAQMWDADLTDADHSGVDRGRF